MNKHFSTSYLSLVDYQSPEIVVFDCFSSSTCFLGEEDLLNSSLCFNRVLSLNKACISIASTCLSWWVFPHLPCFVLSRIFIFFLPKNFLRLILIFHGIFILMTKKTSEDDYESILTFHLFLRFFLYFNIHTKYTLVLWCLELRVLTICCLSTPFVSKHSGI